MTENAVRYDIDREQPVFNEAEYPYHTADDQTVHFFAVAPLETAQDGSVDYQLRYYRAAWDDDQQVHQDSYPVMPASGPNSLEWPIPQLHQLVLQGDLEIAQVLAYHIAQAHQLEFPLPNELPSLVPSSDVNLAAEDAIELETTDPDIQHFQKMFTETQFRLLEPLDSTLNYSFDLLEADPWTVELTANKWWFDEYNLLYNDRQTIQQYALEFDQNGTDFENQTAIHDRDMLIQMAAESGLEVAMHKAENMAVENGELGHDRLDPRFFREGPPDRFMSLGVMLQHEPNPYWNVSDENGFVPSSDVIDISNMETQELPAFSDDEPTWDELMQHSMVETEFALSYHWQMDYYQTITPEGEVLGTALFVTEFPNLPANLFAELEQNGLEDRYMVGARTLEMAHFADEETAQRFEKEFREYLVPGILDGPDLAEGVAQLEGMSGVWEDVNVGSLEAYLESDKTLVRAKNDWHLHNPHIDTEMDQSPGSWPPDFEL